MTELRLVPLAASCWGAIWLVIAVNNPWVLPPLACACALFWWWRGHPQQALLTGTGVLLWGLLAWVRKTTELPCGRIVAQVASAARRTAKGTGYTFQLDFPTVSGTVLGWVADQPPATGATISAMAQCLPVDGNKIHNQLYLLTQVEQLAEPSLLAQFTTNIRASFNQLIAQTIPADHGGLIGGMVLGDTSLQTPYSQEIYQLSGLSHLSAVSGANITIVTSSAVILMTLLRQGPKVRIGAAMLACCFYVLLVGSEPSVLRAFCTGMVGLLAILGSRRMPPLHGLSLSIIVLLAYDSSLALSLGFALSVGATVGIVVGHPYLFKPLARTGMPAIIARALSVTMAAQIATLPLIASIQGKLATNAILANLLVAPVVPAITICGMLATLSLIIHLPVIGMLLLNIIRPLSWWTHNIAILLVELPGSSINIKVTTALLICGWLVVLAPWLLKHKLAVAALVAGTSAIGIIMLAVGQITRPAAINPETLNTIFLDTTPTGSYHAPAGVELVVITDKHPPKGRYPTITIDGVPVVYPHRDGPVWLGTDGTQHATSGKF